MSEYRVQLTEREMGLPRRYRIVRFDGYTDRGWPSWRRVNPSQSFGTREEALEEISRLLLGKQPVGPNPVSHRNEPSRTN